MFVVVRKENVSKFNQPLLFESWMNAIFPKRSLLIIINWLASYFDWWGKVLPVYDLGTAMNFLLMSRILDNTINMVIDFKTTETNCHKVLNRAINLIALIYISF